MSAPPESVLAAYGLTGAAVTRVPGGLINETFFVDGAGDRVVVQRLHPVFGAEVHLDIAAVTEHIAARGMTTPRLVLTVDGAQWVETDGQVWRAITYVDGESFHKVPSLAHAEAGFALMAQFHRAVADLQRAFAFTRAGVHDTAGHLGKLRTVCDPTDALVRDILAAADALPALGALPDRVTHGDLKISNVLFARDAAAPTALCLIDLDTFANQPMAYELGDALRSWCNPAGEDVTEPTVDRDIFAAAMTGYGSLARGLLTEPEVASIVTGFETICIELAARFCVDATEDRYFGWDASRFASRREHNLVRAAGQLSLGRSVAAARDALQAITRAALL